MQPNSPIGSILKGGQPAWSFDMQGGSLMWLSRAEALNEMVILGFHAWQKHVEVLREYFDRARSNPNANEAQPLTVGGTSLFVTFFLAALAVENLLKGVLVIEHPEYIKDGKFRGSVIGSHDLIEVAGDAGIALNQDEHDLCELGTEAILSFGRYPIAKNVNDSPTQITVKEKAFPIYQQLFERLAARIKNKPWK